METEKMLDELHDARCFMDSLNQKQRDALDALITPDIRERVAAIEAEFEQTIVAHTEHVAAIEEAVKDRVLKEGCSTKGTHLHAIFMKGRVSWDGKKLEAWAVGDPRIKAFRTEGSPTVSIRGISK